MGGLKTTSKASFHLPCHGLKVSCCTPLSGDVATISGL